ncbi:hypothetical protein DCO44_14930 [Acinetobacter sp. AM]|uniref:hypothetical protein n=1 Tax=Acinetobacter sp. AM TaxID=2170730 RepID=UPI000DE62529|nr:hypothetical protein [Acinetobacter sp. AM]PWB13238.1 hypothetical protein DCO44_14930 [Acinetobacter sp. AM]
MAGGSQIIISKEGIKIITPAKFEARAGQHLFKSGERVSTALPTLPVLGDKNDYNLRYLLKDKDQNILSQQKYIAFLPNGASVEGTTDEDGYTELFKTIQSEDIFIHLYTNEQLDID